MLAKKRVKNIMEFIPIRRDNIEWIKLENKKIRLIFHRKRLIDKILIFMFNAPERLKIDLDELGSRVWELCDGKNNIYDISVKIREEFGEKAAPVEERLLKFISILRNNNFIYLKEKESHL